MSPERNALTIQTTPCRAARRSSSGRSVVVAALAVAAGTVACRRSDAGIAPEDRQQATAGEVARAAAGAEPTAAGISTVTARLEGRPLVSRAHADLGADAGVPPLVRVNELEPAAPPDACPATMAFVPGGEFWMGSSGGRTRDEQPRFRTRVADICIDTYEVTSASYAQCVELGHCTEPHGSHTTCNYERREDHPINCVDWRQADTYCRSQGARLPTELEWEYAARGGAKYFTFSWGNEPPEDRTCWKGSQTCPVGSYAPGAFGVHDLSGNVWEWTSDWFGDYPWPKLNGRARVYRGGGFNRRFDKGLSTTLRGRTNTGSWGAHLGFRCARLAKDAVCPFGEGDEPGLCRHGVLEAECEAGEAWNGQKCAPPGTVGCGPSEDAVPGHGCVRRPGARAAAREGDDDKADRAKADDIAP